MLGQLLLLKYYKPLSPILFTAKNKIITIHKSSVLRLNHLPRIKYYKPLTPILLAAIIKKEIYLSLI
jgi:hypothetical protein